VIRFDARIDDVARVVSSRSWPWILIVLVLAAAGVSRQSLRAAVATGTIRGRVEVARRVEAPARRPGVAELGESDMPDMPSTGKDETDSRSVVYLESAPLGAFEQPVRTTAIMNQRNETFVPHVLAIMTGTTVEFPNTDRIYHNVFSLSKTTRFDLGRYAAGHSKSVRFDTPGIVRVFCEIHSHMNAFILVFSHPFFAVTTADGRYRIEHVPPGTYNVIAWNEGVTSAPRTVTLTENGTADAEFVVK
jgi:plastocyanin